MRCLSCSLGHYISCWKSWFLSWLLCFQYSVLLAESGRQQEWLKHVSLFNPCGLSRSSSGILSLTWPTLNCCRNLGSKAADGRLLSVSAPFLFICSFQIKWNFFKKRIRMEFHEVRFFDLFSPLSSVL